MSVSWNPWHGCRKISEGCRHCYVYRQDALHERDSREVVRTAAFGLPVRRSRDGRFRIPPGERVYTCFTSDFLVEEADGWRAEAWEMMRLRRDLEFFFITKRIGRLREQLPPDWGDGYENVTVGCTVENQAAADLRLPLFLETPLRHRVIVCAPLLERSDLTPWLGPAVGEVSAGGESGNDAGRATSHGSSRSAGSARPPEFPSPSTRPAPGSSRRGASTAFAGNTSTPRPARRVSTTARNDSPEAVSGTGMRPQREPHGENRPKEAASGQRTATEKSGPPPEKAEEPEA